MLIDLNGRRIYYDLNGPENAQVICCTHSLSSDSGMWAEQLPLMLDAGYRVLRLDMRGHGGSDPVDGDYTIDALADDVAAALDALAIDKVQYMGLSIGGMIGQSFAIRHGGRLISAMLCDTLPATPAGGEAAWKERIGMVKEANSVASARRRHHGPLVHAGIQAGQRSALATDPLNHRHDDAGRIPRLRGGHTQF